MHTRAGTTTPTKAQGSAPLISDLFLSLAQCTHTMDVTRQLQVDSRHGNTFIVAGNQVFNYGSSPNSEKQKDSVAKLLAMLEPARMDASHREECQEGTRTDIMTVVKEWVANTEALANIFWLHGLAGSGKSTLATTLANYFREVGRLGAFLFFSRDEQSEPAAVLGTMAYLIGTTYPKAGAEISNALKNWANFRSSPLRVQFQKLLIDPLSSDGVFDKKQRPIVVLDALDECGNSTQRKRLLEIFVQYSAVLPFRILITSRSKHDIIAAFGRCHHVHTHELSITSDANGRDIDSYLRRRLNCIRENAPHLGLEEGWPSENDVHKVAKRAAGLFVWASTALDFIEEYDPRESMKMLLEKDPQTDAERAIDDLYTTALDSAGNWKHRSFVADFRAVIGLVLVAKRPLSNSAIDSLLRSLTRTAKPCLHTISYFGCVIQAQESKAVRFLHPSFADFLTDRTRCGREYWYFDQAQYNILLAQQCLQHLHNTLKHNMCNLTLSTPLEHQSLSEDMAYVCIFWVDHVCAIEGNNHIITGLVEDFLRWHLLHWFEAMSILRRSRDTIQLLDRLLIWVEAYCSDVNAHTVIRDACRFSRVFAACIHSHPLLVYATAIPFTPTDTSLHRIYHDAEKHPSLSMGTHQSWSELVMVAEHEGAVNSVAFSPDGARIVSGSSDSTVRVWDAHSGAELLPPFRRHSSSVESVAYSYDGTQIGSCSHDKTIRLWDANSGAEIVPVMRGHVSAVKSLAFSPDGTRIVSGSWDTTIRVWNTKSGTEVFPVLRGHKSCVNSVAFSPDGEKIGSAADAGAIRLWDISSTPITSVVLSGHTGAVKSVAFSMDGKQLVSGSSDATIKIWDVASGTVTLSISRPDTVLSVAFSFDGQFVVSGGASTDTAIRTWDVSSGLEARPALRGHERYVHSVSFCRSGKRIVSCSGDGTVRVWEPSSNKDNPQTDPGHDSEVISISFSPNGKQVVSCSNKTIKLWNASTGAEVLQIQSVSLRSVSFSSDGTHIVSSSTHRHRQFWDVLSGSEALSSMESSPTTHAGEIHDPFSRYTFPNNSDGFLSPRRQEVDADYAMAARSPVGSDDFDIPVIKVLDTDGQLVDTITSQVNHGSSPELKATASLSPTTSPSQLPPLIEVKTSDKLGMVPLFPGPIAIEIEDQLLPPSPGGESPIYSPKLFIHTADASSPGSPRSGLNAHTSRHRRTISLTSQDGSTMSDTSSEHHSARSITPFSVDTRRPSSASSPSLKVTQSKWIIDSSTGRTISKLPSTIQTSCSDAFGNSVAFGTITGRIFILNFPNALLSSAETRADGKRKTREWDDDHAFRHKPFFIRSRSSSDVGTSC